MFYQILHANMGYFYEGLPSLCWILIGRDEVDYGAAYEVSLPQVMSCDRLHI